MPASVEITLKSGATVRAHCTDFTIQKAATGRLSGVKWTNPADDQPSRALMFVAADDIAAVVFVDPEADQ
jgi:hypothetical protein